MNHVFDTEHARAYGLPEAVMISNFQFWIAKNRANKENQREGRTWTYNSIKAFTDLFPYLSVGQIRRTLDRLIELKVLIAGTFNERAVDRTKWYAFFDESIFLPQQKHLLDSTNANAEPDKSLYRTDVNTDVNTDKAPAQQAPARPSAPPVRPSVTAKTETKFDPKAALVAAGVEAQHIEDWLEVRKKKRMAFTRSVMDHLQSEAAKANMTVADAVKWCCFKGWGGFESHYMQNQGHDSQVVITAGAAVPRPPVPARVGRPTAFDQSMAAADRAREKLFGKPAP